MGGEAEAIRLYSLDLCLTVQIKVCRTRRYYRRAVARNLRGCYCTVFEVKRFRSSEHKSLAYVGIKSEVQVL
jgi:hypothetical protein